MQFGCQSKLNVAADPAPVRSRRMGLDSGLEKTFFLRLFPNIFLFPPVDFFIANPDRTVCERFRMEQGRFGAVELGKNNGSTISGEKIAVNDEEGEKMLLDYNRNTRSPRTFPVFGDEPNMNYCSVSTTFPHFFWLIGSSSSRIDQKGMTDVRGRTSITPSSKRKKNVLMCFVKVSGVGAHPPYSWTYRPDGCESSFSFDLRLTLTVFSSSVFHLFLLIYLFFIRFREITKFLKQPFKTSSLRTMQKKKGKERKGKRKKKARTRD